VSDRPPTPAAEPAPPSDCGPACQEALADLERFLDGELPAGDIGRVKQHLSACYPCTDRASFEEQLRALVRRGCADAAPPDLVDRIRTGLHSGGLPGVDAAGG
jgi:anti-sigma factor (TIGR02949 family)